MKISHRWFMTLLALLVVCAVVPPAYGDALHGFCWGATPACVDNGTNTPTTSLTPNFGFWVSGGPTAGSDYLVDILIPNSRDPIPSALSFGITGDLTGTASLFSSTAWTSGFLDAFLGISAQPNNPIGAYLPSTQALPGDAGATGFFVYQADLGPATLGGSAGSHPLLSLTSGTLIPGSYLVGFLNEGTSQSPSWTATANSGAIFATPEPNLIWLPTLALAGIISRSLWRRRKSENA